MFYLMKEDDEEFWSEAANAAEAQTSAAVMTYTSPDDDTIACDICDRPTDPDNINTTEEITP